MTKESDEPLFVVLPDPGGRPGPTHGPGATPPPSEPTPPTMSKPRRRLGVLAAAGAGLVAAVVLIAVLRPDADPAADRTPPTPPVRGSATGSPKSSSPEPSSLESSSPEPTTRRTTEPTESTKSTDGPAPVSDPELGSCGSPLRTVTPAFRPLEETTGIRLMFGSGTILDFDSGLLLEPLVDLEEGEFVSQMMRHDDTTYLTLRDCNYRRARVVQVDPGGLTQRVRVPLGTGEQIGQLLDSDQGPMVMVDPTDMGTDGEVTAGVQKLTGGPLTRLPSNFAAYGVVGGRAVGAAWDMDGNGSSLQAVDLITGKATVLAEFDADDGGLAVLEGDRAIWFVTGDDGQSTMTLYTISTGEAVEVPQPVPAAFVPVTVSANGRYVAGYIYPESGRDVVTDQVPDEEFTVDYHLLDLTTGELTQIPSMLRTVDPFGAVAMTFSADGERLVILARTESGVRFLTWKPGDPLLLTSPRVLPLDQLPDLTMLALPAAGATENTGTG